MLKAIRKVVFINKAVRCILKPLGSFSRITKQKILPRWRLAGVIKLQIGPYSFKMDSRCDDLIVDSIYYGWNDEEPEMLLFAEFAKSSRAIYDIGANTGIYSLISSVANQNAKIYAFEPYSINLSRLSKNLQTNNIRQVSTFPYAISSSTEKIKLTVPADDRICTVNSVNSTFTRSFFSEEVTYTETEVEGITLDEFYKKHPTNVDLVKIDVESYEMEVFKGAMYFLKTERPVIFCEIFFDEERKIFFEKLLKELGYEKYVIHETGLKRLEKLEKSEGRTFIFSPRRSESKFLPFSNLPYLISELQISG